MKISIEKALPERVRAEVLVIGLFEDVKALAGEARTLDTALKGKVSAALRSGDFHGKIGDSLLLYTDGKIMAKRLLLLGLGKQAEFDLEGIRRAAGRAVKGVKRLDKKEFHALVPEIAKGVPLWHQARAWTIGALLANYKYTAFKGKEDNGKTECREARLVARDNDKVKEFQKGISQGEVVAEVVNQAREMINSPGNVMTPNKLAETARKLAEENGIKSEVLGPKEIAALRMGGLLAVSRGSDEPSRFIVLDYKPAGRIRKTIAVVGKGITFDSGGISIKPAQGMDQMKYDMAGGAAAIGTAVLAARLKLPFRVVSIIPATENLPSGKALKPGDIIRMYSGKNVEVLNTDAEGRLILADALAYARKFRPNAIIDLATLTGACVVALGSEAAGLLGNDPRLIADMKKAGEASGERVWELPLWKEYNELIKSDVADIKNAGGKEAGTIQGAAFLKQFVEKVPWAHLDIAGVAWLEKEKDYLCKGATGAGIRLLSQLFIDWAGD